MIKKFLFFIFVLFSTNCINLYAQDTINNEKNTQGVGLYNLPEIEIKNIERIIYCSRTVLYGNLSNNYPYTVIRFYISLEGKIISIIKISNRNAEFSKEKIEDFMSCVKEYVEFEIPEAYKKDTMRYSITIKP